ncbi:MAG: tetratricopeptide repeat protein [Pseudomonadota bacterium]
MTPMRAVFIAVIASLSAAGPAFADQTDPLLDALFEELRAGDGAGADATIERIQEIWSDSQSDTVDVLFERAEAALAAGRFDLAGALLDHAIGLSPSFAQAYALRGAVRIEAEDAAGSIADFARAIELEPRQFEARIALAEIMLAGGDERGAYDMLQKALEWNPHEEHARERAKKLRDELNGQEI